ncbi:MAG TPA: S53 family peptidase, partial [Gemmatirosa sp.]
MPPTPPPRLVALPGTERAPVPGARAIGPTPPDELLRVSVHLRARAALPDPALLGAVPVDARPAALTREEFAERYGASDADIAAVRALAAAAGLRVVEEHVARRTVVVEGTAAAIERAFDVRLSRFVHADGTEYRGRVGPVHVPESLAHAVDGVFGLDTRRTARPNAIIRPLPVGTARAAAAPRAWFTPPELGTLYGFPAGDGAGQCIGIIEFGGGFDTNDLTTYWGELQVAPTPTVVAVPVGTATNAPGKDPDSDGEVMLDIEVAGSLAPRATLAVYFSTFTQQGWVDALTTAVHDTTHRPSVLSISWGFAEGHLTWTAAATKAVNDTLQAAALLGVTVCVASGDDGSTDEVSDGQAHVDFPASSPYVLGVGGTALVADAARTRITAETVWNGGPRATGDGAGGGGVSSVFPLPAFQAHANVPPSVNPGHKPGRGVPDVAANADPRTGYFIRTSGQDSVAGGTSAAAPLWAALLARINASGDRPVGYITPLLYASAGAAGCRDITQGNNDPTGKIGGYAAGPGWDACTGWGSPNGAALGPALRTGAATTVASGTPATGTPASGTSEGHAHGHGHGHHPGTPAGGAPAS